MKLLKILGVSSAAKSDPCHRGRRRPLAPRLDALEGRELKDGGIAMIAGTIDITGAAGANSVVVSYANTSHSVVAVTWNNTTAAFNRADVTGIDFEGQNGFYDSFYNLTDISSTAKGGSGRNIFYGGTGNNTLVGGDGANMFWGNGAHDTLTGGNGTNIFYAGTGQDTLAGGNGTNIFYGVTASDAVAVGSGFSFIQRK